MCLSHAAAPWVPWVFQARARGREPWGLGGSGARDAGAAAAQWAGDAGGAVAAGGRLRSSDGGGPPQAPRVVLEFAGMISGDPSSERPQKYVENGDRSSNPMGIDW